MLILLTTWAGDLLSTLPRAPLAVAGPSFPWEAAIVAVAAVAAAGIAAYTAQRRLVAQLGHDRGMRDLEELRRIFDEAAHLAVKAARQTEDALVSVRAHAERREGEVRRAKQLTEEMGAMHQRLGLRLGGDPSTASFGFAVVGLERALRSLEDHVLGSPSEGELDSISAELQNCKIAFGRFTAHARARVRIDAAGEGPSGS